MQGNWLGGNYLISLPVKAATDGEDGWGLQMLFPGLMSVLPSPASLQPQELRARQSCPAGSRSDWGLKQLQKPIAVSSKGHQADALASPSHTSSCRDTCHLVEFRGLLS